MIFISSELAAVRKIVDEFLFMKEGGFSKEEVLKPFFKAVIRIEGRAMIIFAYDRRKIFVG